MSTNSNDHSIVGTVRGAILAFITCVFLCPPIASLFIFLEAQIGPTRQNFSDVYNVFSVVAVPVMFAAFSYAYGLVPATIFGFVMSTFVYFGKRIPWWAPIATTVVTTTMARFFIQLHPIATPSAQLRPIVLTMLLYPISYGYFSSLAYTLPSAFLVWGVLKKTVYQ